MTKEPKNTNEEEEIEVDSIAQETVESLEGYQDYMKEQRGDSLNFGDY